MYRIISWNRLYRPNRKHTIKADAEYLPRMKETMTNIVTAHVGGSGQVRDGAGPALTAVTPPPDLCNTEPRWWNVTYVKYWLAASLCFNQTPPTTAHGCISYITASQATKIIFPNQKVFFWRKKKKLHQRGGLSSLSLGYYHISLEICLYSTIRNRLKIRFFSSHPFQKTVSATYTYAIKTYGTTHSSIHFSILSMLVLCKVVGIQSPPGAWALLWEAALHLLSSTERKSGEA